MQQLQGSPCLGTALSKTCTCTGPACCVLKMVISAAVDNLECLEILSAHRKQLQQSMSDCTRCIASLLSARLAEHICCRMIKQAPDLTEVLAIAFYNSTAASFPMPFSMHNAIPCCHATLPLCCLSRLCRIWNVAETQEYCSYFCLSYHKILPLRVLRLPTGSCLVSLDANR